ncbi:MAG: FGGY family carbohydrate kinase [Planctomycetota bacterium]
MPTPGYLGIDAGTQGLSVLFVDQNMQTVALGEGDYEMVPGLAEGCYEQQPEDWIAALRSASRQLHDKLAAQGVQPEVLAIGISGQMHGEVLADESGQPLGPARLWCDARNDAEGEELTKLLGVKIPKRMTAARWLWTLRNQPERAGRCRRLTTPAGWIAHALTGQWQIGVGDASGMFPIDPQTYGYRTDLLDRFATITDDAPSLAELLPEPRVAGQPAGVLNEAGADLLSLPVGVPVAPAEGDQPASLAASLIGEPGMVSMSFGTSVVANSVSDRPFEGTHAAVDHFCAPDGKPINMVCLTNGTTFLNAVVQMLGGRFEEVMPALLQAPPDCGGLIALPLMDDEPALGVSTGGTATLFGLDAENATPGNAAKAALLATTFNLRIGSEVLAAQGQPRTRIILTGGLAKTPELGQVLADVFATPLVVPDAADEGAAWGAALLAKYLHDSASNTAAPWPEFLESHAAAPLAEFQPDANRSRDYDDVYARYQRLLAARPTLATVNA